MTAGLFSVQEMRRDLVHLKSSISKSLPSNAVIGTAGCGTLSLCNRHDRI